MRIGLTGGIASGKTVAADRLRELGAAIIDADELARSAVLPGSEGLRRIACELGDEMLLQDGSLNRKKLAELVFAEDTARQRLNGILHPIIRDEMLRAAEAAERAGSRVVVLDVPLLIESGWQDMADEVWLVTAPMEQRIDRIAARDGFDRQSAMARIAAQMSDEEKKPYADEIIENDGSLAELYRQTDGLYKRALEKDDGKRKKGRQAPQENKG